MKSMYRLTLLVLTLAFTGLISVPSYARSGPTGFADLAEKLLPSVVNISTTQTITREDGLSDMPELQLPPGSPFEDFFHDFLERRNGGNKNEDGEKTQKRKATSLGSGFIVDSSGIIVTNNHVIQDADEITVILHDDTNLTAKVIGRDKKTDLAVLQVTPKKPLTSVSWGDSDKIRVGDWILAIGNPFGLGGTVTTGIISARARDIQSGPYDDYLQTDAPINRGNSGGPMFNMEGEVIGINTAIFSPSGGSVGIGFAIPSSMAKGVIDQLKNHGRTRRGWLGVRIQLVTPEIAEGLNLGTPKGALVAGITDGGPAAEAKIEIGDVIVGFDGKDVPEMRRLPRLVAETEVDRTVPIVVMRKGKEIHLSVKVGELESHDESANEESDRSEKTQQVPNAEKIEELGLSVAPTTDSLRKKYALKKEVNGLVIVKVNPNGQAADYGILPGDVISEVGQQEIKTTKEFAEIVKKAKKENKPLLMLLDRKGDLRFIAVSFGKK